MLIIMNNESHKFVSSHWTGLIVAVYHRLLTFNNSTDTLWDSLMSVSMTQGHISCTENSEIAFISLGFACNNSNIKYTLNEMTPFILQPVDDGECWHPDRGFVTLHNKELIYLSHIPMTQPEIEIQNGASLFEYTLFRCWVCSLLAKTLINWFRVELRTQWTGM